MNRRAKQRALAAVVLAGAFAAPAFTTPAAAVPPSEAIAGVVLPPPAMPMARFLQSGVVPPVQLKQAIAKAKAGRTVQVCIAGDSTSSTTTVGTPNGVHLTDGLWYSLMRAIQDQNPGVTFAFQNFAIPGTTMGQFTNATAFGNAAASGLDWYTDRTTDWYRYVGQRTPCDIEILNWGVNDGWNVGPGLVEATIAGTQAHGHPGIIWMTNGAANPNVDGLATDQAGFIALPSLMRSMAALGAAGFRSTPDGYPSSIGLIDVGRVFEMAYLGRDYGDQTSVDVTTSLNPSMARITPAAPYLLPRTDGDFDVAATFPDAIPARRGIFFTIGSFDGRSYNDPVVYVTPNGAGGDYVNYSGGGDVGFGPVFLPATGRDLAIEIAVKQDFLTVVVNGHVIQKTVIKPTAPFTPSIYVDSGNPGQSVVISKYVAAVARRYAPVLNTRQAYGPTLITAKAGASSAGGTTITLAAPVSVEIVGEPVTDLSAPGAIPGGTKVLNVDAPATAAPIVTLSGSGPTGAGIGRNDTLLFGSPINPIGTGGNGINHPASDGWNAIWGSAIAQADFGLVKYFGSRYALGGLAGAGATLATAYPVYADIDTFTVVESGTGATLPDYPVGETVTLFNDGKAALNVWPNSAADRIGTAAAGSAVVLPSQEMAVFERDTAQHWFRVR